MTAHRSNAHAPMHGEGNCRRTPSVLVAAAAVTMLLTQASQSLAQPSALQRQCAGTGSLDDIVAACTTLIRSGRESAGNLAIGHLNRGIAYGRKGDDDRAIEDFSAALRLRPGYAKAFHSRGIAHAKKDDIAKAIEDLNCAIVNEPGYAPAFAARGLAYAKKGEIDRAIRDLDEAIRLDATSAQTHNSRGVLRGRRNNLAGARADFDRAIQLAPTFVAAYNNRGQLLRQLGELARAEADLSEAVRLDPSYLLGYMNRGLVREQQRDLLAARADFETVLALNAVHEGASAGHARVLASLRRPSTPDRAAGLDARAVTQAVEREAPAGKAAAIDMRMARASVGDVAPRQQQAVSVVAQRSVADAGTSQNSSRTGGSAGAAAAPERPVVAATFSSTVAACARFAAQAPLALGGEGGKAKVVLPACFRGRQHLDCVVEALQGEAKAIDAEYGSIALARYGDFKETGAICRVPLRQIEDHLARVKGFDSRVDGLRKVFDETTTCVEGVRESIGALDLGAMRNPADLMKSVVESVAAPVEQASARQREVLKMGEAIGKAHGSMATLRDLRKLVCPLDTIQARD